MPGSRALARAIVRIEVFIQVPPKTRTPITKTPSTMEGVVLMSIVINHEPCRPGEFIQSAQISDAAYFYGLTIVSPTIVLCTCVHFLVGQCASNGVTMET